jgi:hypothetical protein
VGVGGMKVGARVWCFAPICEDGVRVCISNMSSTSPALALLQLIGMLVATFPSS